MKRLLQSSAALVALLASPVLAADLAVKRPLPPPPAPVYNWTGFYGGINAGWVGSANSMSNQAIPTPDAVLGVVPGVTEGLAALSTGSVPVGHNRSGFIGGGQIGYNYQVNSWLAGVEADIQGISGQSSSGSLTTGAVVVLVPVNSTLTGTMDTSWLGTVRGRLGFLPSPTWLVYGTGGLAYGGVNASTFLTQTGTNGFIGGGGGTFSETRTGWTAGGGTEWMFAPQWTVRLEYLHYDLGTANFSWSALGAVNSAFFAGAVFQTEVTSVHFKGDIVRAGLNYKF